MCISFIIFFVGIEVFVGEVCLVGCFFNMESKMVCVYGYIEGKYFNFICGFYVEVKIWNDVVIVKVFLEGVIILEDGLDYIFVLEEEILDGLYFCCILVKVGEVDNGFMVV